MRTYEKNIKQIEIKDLIRELASEEKKIEWDEKYKSLVAKDYKNMFKFTTYIEDISEIKIHKILYYLHGFYQSKYNKNLFDNPRFESWKYGPVEMTFRRTKARNIKFSGVQEEDEWIKKILFNLMRYETEHLIDMTHDTDPWIKAGSGKKIHEEIKNSDIREFFDKLIV